MNKQRTALAAATAAALAAPIVGQAVAADAAYPSSRTGGSQVVWNDSAWCITSFAWTWSSAASAAATTYYDPEYASKYAVGDASCDSSMSRIYYNNGYRTSGWSTGPHSYRYNDGTSVTSVQGSGSWVKYNGYTSGELRLY